MSDSTARPICPHCGRPDPNTLTQEGAERLREGKQDLYCHHCDKTFRPKSPTLLAREPEPPKLGEEITPHEERRAGSQWQGTQGTRKIVQVGDGAKAYIRH